MVFLNFLSRLDRFLAPSLCPLCRKNLASDGEACPDCREKLPFITGRRCRSCGGPLDGVLDICRDCAELDSRPWYRGVTAFHYQDEIRLAVHQFKYRQTTCLARFFARQMALAWQEHREFSRPELITPVPLHWLRAWKRGYNQSGLLTEFLAAELQLPCRQLLRRSRNTISQATLNRHQRLNNLRKAFQVRDPGSVAGRSILLVDDVFTTGSTLTCATAALLDAGAAEVSILTIARD